MTTRQDLELKQRRIRVVAAFASMFVLGLGLFFLGPEGSHLQGIGLAFMIGWIPGLAWFTVWFAKKRAPMKLVVPPRFTHETPYEAHLQLEATFTHDPHPAAGPQGAPELVCLLLLGTEGFTVRVWGAPSDDGAWANASPVRLTAQLLSPAVALPRFPPATETQLLVGRTVVGRATVAPLQPASPA